MHSYGGNGQQSYGSYGGGYGGIPSSSSPDGTGATLRRRTLDTDDNHANGGTTPSRRGGGPTTPKSVVRKLDFMFPKVDTEYTIRTEGGGIASMIAVCLIAVLVIAECVAWRGQNTSSTEHISVDTSLGKRMQVNLNITFPALACEDLHVDVMDVAGDSQLNIEDTMVKQRLTLKGYRLGEQEKVESNKHAVEERKEKEILKTDLPPDYCGPCFGAEDTSTDPRLDSNSNGTDVENQEPPAKQCCNTCDELIAAYEKKRWRTDVIKMTSEQCIREGRNKKTEPKRMKKGEGCNLSGSMTLNRVAGNFHIAMGEGVERDGRHIHSFVPDDTPNFNASHIIHHLSFGAQHDSLKDFNHVAIKHMSPLVGVEKTVTRAVGTTGLFQYFIKIVPTTFVKGTSPQQRIETNRYFFTERFRPLISKVITDRDDDGYDDDHVLDDDQEAVEGKKAVPAGGRGGHSNHEHHDVRNAILPGVFFIYEIYPFAVEISENSVPFTHLLIRIMATVGGVFTIMKWADSFVYSHSGRRRSAVHLS